MIKPKLPPIKFTLFREKCKVNFNYYYTQIISCNFQFCLTYQHFHIVNVWPTAILNQLALIKSPINKAICHER